MFTHTDIDTAELYSNLRAALKNGCALLTGPTPVLSQIFTMVEKSSPDSVCELHWPVASPNATILLCDVEALVEVDILSASVLDHDGTILAINYSTVDDNNEMIPAIVWCDDEILNIAIFWLLQGLAASNGSYFVPGEMNVEGDPEPSDIECTDA